MGCTSSRGKIYLAQNEDIVNAHATTLQELDLSFEEGATLLQVYSILEKATAIESKFLGGVGVQFSSFASKLGIQKTKFALNVFARGANVPDGAFPQQKLAARMDSRQFVRTICDLCLRTNTGLNGFAFDLYKDRSDGITTKAMIKLVHETYDFLAEAESSDEQEANDYSKRMTAKADQTVTFIVEVAGNDGVFQRNEFDQFVGKRHQTLQQVFLLQNAVRDKTGGSSFWKKLIVRIGKE
jgi:hypothetical protein